MTSRLWSSISIHLDAHLFRAHLATTDEVGDSSIHGARMRLRAHVVLGRIHLDLYHLVRIAGPAANHRLPGRTDGADHEIVAEDVAPLPAALFDVFQGDAEEEAK